MSALSNRTDEAIVDCPVSSLPTLETRMSWRDDPSY